MDDRLTAEALCNIESLALKLMADPNTGAGLRAAAKNFIPRAAKLRSHLIIEESERQMKEAAQTRG